MKLSEPATVFQSPENIDLRAPQPELSEIRNLEITPTPSGPSINRTASPLSLGKQSPSDDDLKDAEELHKLINKLNS